MSMKLMHHVRVLVVGVALIAMTLTIAPDVANAKTKLDGKVDAALNDGGGDGGTHKGDGGGKNQGDGGANLDGKVDAALKGDAGGNLGDTTVDSATRADQQVDLDDPPLVGGDIKSINEVNAPLVPAKGEAKADGNIKAGELIDEGFCVRGALNQSASGCDGGTTPGGGSTGGGNGDMVTTPDIDAEAALGDNAVSSDTASNQRVDFDNSPLVGGDTNSTTEVIAPLVPAEGEAKVDEKVEVGDLVNEDICLTAALNRNAGGCGSGGAGGSGDDIVTIPDIDLGEILKDIDADSDTTIDETVNPNKPELDGTVNNRNDIVAPGIPASAEADLRGNAKVDELVNQDVNSCTTLNAPDCAGGAAPAPGNGNGGSGSDLDEILKDIDAHSDTTINETVKPDEPRLDGTRDSATNVDAPGVPASAKAELKGNAKVDELVNQDVGVCGTLNAADCKDDATPGNGNGNNGIDLGKLPDNTTVDSVTDIDEKVNPNKPELDGTVDNRNDIVAPIVPASAVVDLDGNAKLGELVNQDVNSCTTLNAAGCTDAAAPGPVDSTPGDDGNGDGDDSTPDDDASAPGDGSGSDDSGSGSVDNGGSSGSSNSGSSNSGNGSSDSGSSDDGDELAFTAPADRNGGGSGDNSSNSGSGSSGSGSSDDGDELAFAALTSGQASASSGSATKSGDRLLDTGGVSPLVLIAALLFIGSGILLVTKRRRFNS